MRHALSLALLLPLASSSGCASAPQDPPAPDGSIGDSALDAGAEAPEDTTSLLARHLEGRFDSAAQAARDPSYFEIHLASCAVDAPALGAHVLYVEQAAAGALGRPYRQRLYVIEPTDDPAVAVSRVFELADNAAWIGACDRDTRAASASDASEKVGCAVTMRWGGARFEGGTTGTECASTRDGASYTTSEVTVDAAGMASWDRGFDGSGAQVWGAVAGPYQFERRSPMRAR